MSWKNVFENTPGYLKWSNSKLANKFGVTEDHIKSLRSLHKKNKITSNVKVASKKVVKKAVKNGIQKQKPLVSINNKVQPVKTDTIIIDENCFREPIQIKNRSLPGTYLITGCSHAPWHNKKMYNSIFNYLSKENIELQGLILAGDFLEMNSLSSHAKGKVALKDVTLDWEYKEANKFLNELTSLKYSKKSTLDYLYGNHEDRYLRLMSNNDESKYGNSLQSPEVGLNLKERGFELFTNWKDDCIHLGPHLDVNHGEFLNVHSAKKTIDTYRKSCLYFHTHRFQIYVEGAVGGWNMGTGANIDAPIFNYATRAMKNSWVNSCALVNLDSNGFYHVNPLMFLNNKLIINGRNY